MSDRNKSFASPARCLKFQTILPAAVKLLIPTTVQTGEVAVGAAVLRTTGPPTSAYYTFACYKWSQIFWISK
jgi:hypothetical protein